MISLNPKPHIAFRGLPEDIEISRQILSGFRKEFGRPHSNTYVEAKIFQHIDDDAKTDLLIKLCSVRDKYNSEVKKLRTELKNWLNLMQVTNKCLVEFNFAKTKPVITLDDYMKKLKELVSTGGGINCEEYSDILQYEHLKKGIETEVVGVCIYSKLRDQFLRNHSFCLRNLPEGANPERISTWGDNAVIADSWIGIVDKAIDTPIDTVKNGKIISGEFIEGGFTKILKFLKFNPDTEKIRLFSCNKIYAHDFIRNMRKEKTSAA